MNESSTAEYKSAYKRHMAVGGSNPLLDDKGPVDNPYENTPFIKLFMQPSMKALIDRRRKRWGMNRSAYIRFVLYKTLRKK